MESNYGKYLFCSWIFSGFLYETAKVASLTTMIDLQPLLILPPQVLIL